MFELLRRWCNASSRRRRSPTANVRKCSTRPLLEILEDRFAPAVFNATSTAGILNPSAGGVTLVSPIEAGNAIPGGSTINLTIANDNQNQLPGTPGEIDNAVAELAIAAAFGNLTIQNTNGGAVTVDANPLKRVFDITPFFTISSAIVTDGGNGFTSAPTVTLIGGGGTGATATATIANGQVASVTITNPGKGYTSPPTIIFTGGGGQGAIAIAIVA